MPTYLDRYLAGEHEQVWDELMALGAAVRDEPLYTDALAVARETMRRARYNCQLIVGKLESNGYYFERPKTHFELTSASDIAELEEVEAAIGVLPLSLREWYELVSNVNLSGTHPNWKVCGNKKICRELYPNWHLFGDSSASYALRISQVDRATRIRKDKEIEEEARRQSLNSGVIPYLDVKALIVTNNFSGYGERFNGCIEGIMMEDYISGVTIRDEGEVTDNNPVGFSEIVAPDTGIDGYFRRPEYNIALTFVGYLRKSFEWGGFPGFANVDEELRPKEWLAELTEGLLPI